MFSLLSKLSRSRKAQTIEQSMPAARGASIETLEDRRLYSVSSGGDLSSFSWGATNAGTCGVRLPAVQQPGTNIIAILIG
jgi:hypothetical protein